MKARRERCPEYLSPEAVCEGAALCLVVESRITGGIEVRTRVLVRPCSELTGWLDR